MKLILGLGNPGRDYAGTRHNTGFTMLDALAAEWGGTWQEKSRFKTLTAEVATEGQKVILAKPTTFYNLSGEATRAIMDFYKIPVSNVLVVHDEIDLPFGTIRTRIGGSSAGNNGIKSLIAHIGQDFARIRVGIASEQLPVIGAHDFVLGRFTPDEQLLLEKIQKTTLEYCGHFIASDRDFTHHSVTHTR